MNYLDIKNLDTFSNLGSTDSVLLNKEDNSNFAGSITGDSLRKSLGVYGGIFNVTTCIPLSAGQLYTAETAKSLTHEKLVNEFAQAHMNSISKTDPNLSILKNELLERLNKVALVPNA